MPHSGSLGVSLSCTRPKNSDPKSPLGAFLIQVSRSGVLGVHWSTLFTETAATEVHYGSGELSVYVKTLMYVRALEMFLAVFLAKFILKRETFFMKGVSRIFSVWQNGLK